MLKALTMFVGMFVAAQAAPTVPPQAQPSATVSRQHPGRATENIRNSSTTVPSNSVPQLEDTSPRTSGYDDSSSTHPHLQPHISFSVPNTPPAQWSLHERIAWGANLALAAIGYVGIVIAIRALKRIEAQSKSLEVLAQTAIESSSTVKLAVQDLVSSRRPWVLMSVTRSLGTKDSFSIVATNRGSAPAQITSCPDNVVLIKGEFCLPGESERATEESGVLAVPIMLLPGESNVIQRFSRGDVSWVCKTEESLRHVERFEETIYIYGTIFYRNPAMSNIKQSYQTDWWCKYTHGDCASEIVIGGPFGSSRQT